MNNVKNHNHDSVQNDNNKMIVLKMNSDKPNIDCYVDLKNDNDDNTHIMAGIVMIVTALIYVERKKILAWHFSLFSCQTRKMTERLKH